VVLVITPGERRALQMLADGTAMCAVADQLGTTEPETAARLSGLFARMGAASRADAVSVALRRGLLTSVHQRREPSEPGPA
jgi:DNA-binding NarL/FixJ family response regulator